MKGLFGRRGEDRGNVDRSRVAALMKGESQDGVDIVGAEYMGVIPYVDESVIHVVDQDKNLGVYTM